MDLGKHLDYFYPNHVVVLAEKSAPKHLFRRNLFVLVFFVSVNKINIPFLSWKQFKFGLRSCFHHKTEDIVIKLVMGLLVHILCGYVTLPLYALVTQV